MILTPPQQIAVDSVLNALKAGHKEITLQLPIGWGGSTIAVALANRINGVIAFKHRAMGDQMHEIAKRMELNAWAVLLDRHNTFEPIRNAAPIVIVCDDVSDFAPPPGYTVVRIALGFAQPFVKTAPLAQPLNHAQRMRVYRTIMMPMIDAGMLAVEWQVPDGMRQVDGRHVYRAPGVKR